MAAQKKFISPPTFSAKPGESAQDCLERFLLTGRYNHWDEAEIRGNFVMYLEGTALKWFLFPIYQRTGTTRQRWPQRRTPQQPVCGWITNRLPRVILPRQLRSHPRSKITKTFSKGKKRPSNTLLWYSAYVPHNQPDFVAEILEHLYNGLRRSLVKKIYLCVMSQSEGRKQSWPYKKGGEFGKIIIFQHGILSTMCAWARSSIFLNWERLATHCSTLRTVWLDDVQESVRMAVLGLCWSTAKTWPICSAQPYGPVLHVSRNLFSFCFCFYLWWCFCFVFVFVFFRYI